MKNIALELEFEGPDAHVTSIALANFEAAFKKDPTGAAHQLHRYLETVVESKRNDKPVQIKFVSKGSSNVFSLSAFSARLRKRPSYGDLV